MRAASGGSMPPSTPSLPTIRIPTAKDGLVDARIAASTSRANRIRSAPYASSRVFVSGERNEWTRYEWAPCTSTPSSPARSARAAAAAKPSTTASIIACVIGCAIRPWIGSASREGAHAGEPSRGNAWMPPCQSWAKTQVSSACSRSASSARPGTTSSRQATSGPGELGCTVHVSVKTEPTPPLARASW